MDLLLAIVLVICAWIIFKSLVGVLLTLLIVAVALYVVRGGNRRS